MVRLEQGERSHTRLPLLPALDGIRAIAVIAVLLYHAEVFWVPGGFLGVEVFFVLSGYLITSLLWSELRETGRISLKRFWVRRARRLLPALFVMLGVVATTLVLGWPDEIARVRGDILAAFGYFSNWYLIGIDQSYFSSLGRPSPFGHLWSLAIEEQFYLLWPVVLGVLALRLRGARRIARVVLRVAGLSAVAMFLLHDAADPSRAYFGTDTRAAGLLLGSALALVWRPFDPARKPFPLTARALDGVTVGATAFLVYAFMRYDETTSFTLRPGILLVSLATCALIAASVHPRARLARAIGWAPLQEIGKRSYSIYLWHWPVFVVTRPEVDLDLGVGPALVLRLAITLVLAELSYRYVEVPIRSGAIGRALDRLATGAYQSQRRYRRVLVGSMSAAVATIALAAVVGNAIVRMPAPGPSDAELSLTAAVKRTSPRAKTVAMEVRSEIAPRVGSIPYVRSSPRTIRPAGPRLVEVVRPIRAMRARVVMLGDSVMLGARDTLPNRIGAVRVNAAVSRQMNEGLEILRRLRDEARLGEAVVIHLGNNGSFTAEQFDQLMWIVRAVPKVVVVNVKVPRRWERSVNAVIENGVGRHGATLVDWHAGWRSCGGDVFYSDGLHLTPFGARCYAGMIARAL